MVHELASRNALRFSIVCLEINSSANLIYDIFGYMRSLKSEKCLCVVKLVEQEKCKASDNTDPRSPKWRHFTGMTSPRPPLIRSDVRSALYKRMHGNKPLILHSYWTYDFRGIVKVSFCYCRYRNSNRFWFPLVWTSFVSCESNWTRVVFFCRKLWKMVILSILKTIKSLQHL